MKTNFYKILINLLLFAALIAQYSCKKDKVESFVDDYNPKLTEAAGISHDGDYFPLNTGYQWNWEGEATTTGSYNGKSLDETNDVYGYMNISQQTSIILPSGSYNAYQTLETQGIKRYFEKTGSAINLRAITNLDGSDDLIEVKNPCYIKKPLVVGDKWSAQPQMDAQLTETLGDIDISDLQINCNFYVIGKENITWEGKTTETVRLDERAEISGNLTYNEGGQSGSVNISVTMTVTLNLLEDVGIIAQKEDLNVQTSGDVNMNVNVKSNIALTYYYSNEIPMPIKSVKPDAKISEELPWLKSTNPIEKKVLKLIQVLKKISF